MTAKPSRLTGAFPGEQSRVWACFGSLLFLMASYYLLKPLRNSQFLKDFFPQTQPLFYLLVSLLSFTATKTFSLLYERLDKARLLSLTFAIICLCKLIFAVALPVGGKAISAFFFLWASTYFLLALAAIWGCINELFHPHQGERCYGFIAAGSTVGCIVGSQMSSKLAMPAGPTLVLSAAFMVVSLLLILLARRVGEGPPSEAAVVHDVPETSMLSEITTLLARPYLRSIGAMVLCLAVYSTAVEFISTNKMDHRLAQAVYLEQFAGLNQELNKGSGEALNSEGFDFIYSLRAATREEREPKLAAFASEHHLKEDGSQLGFAYQSYSTLLNGRTKDFYSNLFLYQGLFSIVALTALGRWLFMRVGVHNAILIMPIFAIMSLTSFGFQLDLPMIQALLVAGGVVNYSLNNATKELLYTVTSTDEKYKVKPLIEGPVMRLGDMLASLVNLGCAALATSLALPSSGRDQMYLFVCILVCLGWLRQVLFAGREYHRLRELDPQ